MASITCNYESYLKLKWNENCFKTTKSSNDSYFISSDITEILNTAWPAAVQSTGQSVTVTCCLKSESLSREKFSYIIAAVLLFETRTERKYVIEVYSFNVATSLWKFASLRSNVHQGCNQLFPEDGAKCKIVGLAVNEFKLVVCSLKLPILWTSSPKEVVSWFFRPLAWLQVCL